jgi:hypothetical protein
VRAVWFGLALLGVLSVLCGLVAVVAHPTWVGLVMILAGFAVVAVAGRRL